MSATTPKLFKSSVKFLNKFEASNKDIKNEPMFFNCDLEFAHEKGGPITRSFIEALPHDWKYQPAVFDSRSHMLMPGWFPAIPGWHHDDVPRPIIPTGQHFITAGQPDYDNPRYLSEHIMALVNSEVCPTAFAIGDCIMPAIPEEGLIYREWHKEVDRLLSEGLLTKIEAPSNQLIYFDWQSFHTGQRAISNGWRWFGRVTRNSDRVNNITNEIRNQTQVYLEFPMEGW
jgi:hypothetical protein